MRLQHTAPHDLWSKEEPYIIEGRVHPSCVPITRGFRNREATDSPRARPIFGNEAGAKLVDDTASDDGPIATLSLQ
jgi:hypothetical protein